MSLRGNRLPEITGTAVSPSVLNTAITICVVVLCCIYTIFQEEKTLCQ